MGHSHLGYMRASCLSHPSQWLPIWESQTPEDSGIVAGSMNSHAHVCTSHTLSADRVLCMIEVNV